VKLSITVRATHIKETDVLNIGYAKYTTSSTDKQ